MTTLKTAKRLVNASISAIPIGANKVPAIQWKEFCSRLATPDELAAWYSAGANGIGRVGGAISGNLETIDFDVDDETPDFAYTADQLMQAWAAAVKMTAPALCERLTFIRTPRPGWHVAYRCKSPVEGNLRLAAVPTPSGGWKAVIETRGEGGYALHPGSPAHCHPSGRPYEHAGGPAIENAQPISAAERAILLQAARQFCQKPTAEAPKRPASLGVTINVTPGDAFNETATWADVLEPLGWTFVGHDGDAQHWKRPGGNSKLSATANFDGSGLLYPFSTNCGLEPNRGYSKFGVYTLLNHAGDFDAAATALRAQGFGDNGPAPSMPLFTPDMPTRCVPAGSCPRTPARCKPTG